MMILVTMFHQTCVNCSLVSDYTHSALTMSPAPAAVVPPMGPITFKRQRSKSQTERKESHGCPMGFVRPDLVSRCTWKPNETKADVKNMKQGPHSLDKP